MEDLPAIAKMAGEFGPFVVIIMLLLRANANKDKIIAELTTKALEMAQENRRVVQIVKEGVQP